MKYGTHVETGEAVAIKVMSKKYMEKEDMVTSVTREVSILYQLKHPAIVQLKDVMASDKKVYIVMEYMAGI